MRKRSFLIALLSISFALSAQNTKQESSFTGLHQAPLYVSVSLDANLFIGLIKAAILKHFVPTFLVKTVCIMY
mgnify:CR=1 FL=1